MTKVLLIGEIYSDNLGDGIIYDNMKHELEQLHPFVEIVPYDLSLRTDFNQRDETVKKSLIKGVVQKFIPVFFDNLKLKKDLFNYQKLTKLYYQDIDYDAAIFCGGQIFSKYFLANIFHLVKILEEKNIPIFFYGVGIGEIRTKFQRDILDEILTSKTVQRISVRDGFEFLKNLFPDLEISKVYDVALLSPITYNIQINQLGKIGLGIMEVKGKRKEILKFWSDLIPILCSRNKNKIVIFTNGNIDDYRLANQIYDKFKNQYSNLEITQRPLSTQALVEQISSFDKIISFRLHSHIIASSMSIPSVALIWDKKVEEFFEFIGVTGNCFSFENVRVANDVMNAFENLNELYIKVKSIDNIQNNIHCEVKHILKGITNE